MPQSPYLMQTTLYTSLQLSFIGSHQRTIRSRTMLHIVTYIAIFVAWMLIWSRRGTHTAGLHRHSPFRDQYKYYSSRQLAANPWLRENTSRHAVTYGSVTGPEPHGDQLACGAYAPTRQEFHVHLLHILPIPHQRMQQQTGHS